MEVLEARVKAAVTKIAKEYQVKQTMEWFEFFPASKNDAAAAAPVQKVTQQQGIELQRTKTLLRFGEDFGWFSKSIKVCFLAWGRGKLIHRYITLILIFRML